MVRLYLRIVWEDAEERGRRRLGIKIDQKNSQTTVCRKVRCQKHGCCCFCRSTFVVADCDDFALSYNRWCKYNAGKQCQSIRVDGLTLGKTSTVSLKIERKSESEFTATESVDENVPKWARDFLGVYTLPPIDVNGPDVYSSKLRFKNHIYSYAYVDGTFSGKSWQRTFPCDSETKLCSYFISYLPNRPFIEVSLVSHDKKSGHVMIAHEVEASPNLNKYCLVEYYYWPEDGGDKPLIYGCWSQSKEDQAIKIPPYVLDKIPTMFGGDSNYTVGWVSKEPNHSEVSDEFEFSKIKVGHSNVKVATLPSTNLSYKLNEPEYNRLKATSFLFSYITGLDAHSAQPLTESEISKRYLDNPRALEIYFVLSGQFPEARKADHDPFRRNSNFSVRPFGDIKKSLLDLEKMGALSK